MAQPSPRLTPRLRKLAPRLIGMALFVQALSTPASAGELRAGAAMVKITPPAGIPLAGYYHERGAEGVHDDLHARALVLERDGVTVALVSLDLIGTRRRFVEEARQQIEAQTGIPGARVMISATHAHTGPVLAPDPGQGEVSASSSGDGAALIEAYTIQLPARITESVKEAYARRRVVRVSSATGREETLAFNRRFHMKDGTVAWNPGKLHRDIVKPAGPIDPAVPVVFFETPEPERKPVATYVNYAVHLDNVGGLKISADLPFTLTECLSRALGPEHVTLWTAGTCGDINHINVAWDRPQGGPENAARMGVVLAGEVLRLWPDLRPVGEGPLQALSELVALPLPEVTEAEVAEAREVVGTVRDSDRGGFMKLVRAYKVLDVANRGGRPWEVEAQVITLGQDLAWVALPGEVFVQLGLDLKLDSPFGQTMIAELANGSVGYIPNRRAYPQGNYEVVSARCAEGSGEQLVEAAVRMLKRLHSAAAP